MDKALDSVIKAIKQKKELSGIDNSIILELLESYLKKRNLTLEFLSGSEVKIIVKDIRAELRNYVGRFQIKPRQRIQLLKESDFENLLKTHSSTKERLLFYPKLKKLISSLSIKSILDMACGLNPLALASPDVKYYASDINKAELDIVNKFFMKNHIDGEVFVCDLRRIKSCNLPKTDICLLFKVLDIIEKKGHRLAESIITEIPSKYLLASFSTKKLSGKPMGHPQREWIEQLLKRLNYSFEVIMSDNEIFYLIKK